MIMHLPIRRPGLAGRSARKTGGRSAGWWRRRLEDISLVLAFVLFIAVQSAMAHARPATVPAATPAAIVLPRHDGVKPVDVRSRRVNRNSGRALP